MIIRRKAEAQGPLTAGRPRKLCSFASTLLRGDSGVAAVEFAMIAPVLILFVVGTLEMSVLFSVNNALEGAVAEAARAGMTGGKGSSATREEYIRSAVDRIAGSLVDAHSVELTTMVYPSFDNIGKPEPFKDTNGDGVRQNNEPFTDVNGNGVWDSDMGRAGLGGPNDIVLYRVSYDWQPITPMISKILSNDGKITLSTTFAIRNEPYE